MHKKIKLFPCCLLASLIIFGCEEKTPPKDMVRMVRAAKVSDPAEIANRWFPGQARATQEVDLSFREACPLIERKKWVI